MRVCIHTCTIYIHTHVHTYIHTHIYTHLKMNLELHLKPYIKINSRWAVYLNVDLKILECNMEEHLYDRGRGFLNRIVKEMIEPH